MTAELMAPVGPVGTAAACPGCGSERTVWVRAGSQDNLLCKTCGACWHSGPADGPATRVNAAACAGCGLRAVCSAALGLAAA